MNWDEHAPFFRARRTGSTTPREEDDFVFRNRGFYGYIVNSWKWAFDSEECESIASYAFARAMNDYDPDHPDKVHFHGFLRGVARQVFTDEIRRRDREAQKIEAYISSLDLTKRVSEPSIILTDSTSRGIHDASLPRALIADRESLLRHMDAALDEREYVIVSLAYGLASRSIADEGLNDVQIGRIFNVTNSRIQELRTRALDKIKWSYQREFLDREVDRSIRRRLAG